jgi:hypothetical protein
MQSIKLNLYLFYIIFFFFCFSLFSRSFSFFFRTLPLFYSFSLPFHTLSRLDDSCCPDGRGTCDCFPRSYSERKTNGERRSWKHGYSTERHGRLLRDRKSIPDSRYGSGSHRDGDSAPYRISGWNSFGY